MKLLLENWRKHLDDQNEGYFEHMFAAWKLVYMFKILTLKCLVHSFMPFMFTTAVSSKLPLLERMVHRNKNNP